MKVATLQALLRTVPDPEDAEVVIQLADVGFSEVAIKQMEVVSPFSGATMVILKAGAAA